jgi:hypothetical protein
MTQQQKTLKTAAAAVAVAAQAVAVAAVAVAVAVLAVALIQVRSRDASSQQHCGIAATTFVEHIAICVAATT